MFSCKLKLAIKRRIAFTLAEVLLTLTIIGVVSAMTIPTLITEIENHQNIVAMKKQFSTFNQVYSRIVAENGSMKLALSGCGNGDHDCFKNILKKHLNYVKECSDGQTLGNCFPDDLKHLNGDNAYNYSFWLNPSGLILSDGALVDIFLDKPACTQSRTEFSDECGWVSIDVNGFKGPNTWGKDVYNFMFYSNVLRATGTKGDGFDSSCTSTSLGLGCAAKYLYNK